MHGMLEQCLTIIPLLQFLNHHYKKEFYMQVRMMDIFKLQQMVELHGKKYL